MVDFIHITFDANQFKRDVNEYIEGKIRAIRKDPGLYRDLVEELGILLHPFVPEDTGQLADFRVDTNYGLVYRRFNEKNGFNVAVDQYETPYHHKKPTATDHWGDEYHQALIWDDFIAKATPLIEDFLKEK